MSLRTWLERQAPDFVQTWLRFPLAIVLAALNTAIVIGAVNEVGWLREEVWGRGALGFATGAVLAVAGVYFVESRPAARPWGLTLKYLVPLLAVAAFQVTDIAWLVPYALPVVAILWLSISPFTRVESGVAREEQQSHQALATAAIAAGAFAIIALGFLVIERSLSVLFGLDSGTLFYKWLLPFTGLFLTPVYWLSTLPRLDEVQAGAVERPEFIGKAVGFLGQFVLVPMLFLYGLILLAYTAQIIVTQKLPEGMIGWMVMGFVIVGAATWLVLYPPFMRDKPLVKLFRRLWFWLTLVPLGLFFFAVWVRVDAYGFTSERMLLLAGGIWAVVLAAIFLLKRGDIRLIPALAAALLLLLSVGPWNFAYLPLQQQLLRLDVLVMGTGTDQTLSPPRPDWSGEEIAEARGIIDYVSGTREGRRAVREMMGRYGVTWPAEQDGSYAVLTALNLDPDGGLFTERVRYRTVSRDFDTMAVPVAATPYLIRGTAFYADSSNAVGPISVGIYAGKLVVRSSLAPTTDPALPEPETQVDLAPLVAREQGSTLVEPWVDFAFGGVNYRFALESVNIDEGETGAETPVVYSLSGDLFADRPLTPTP